MVPFDANTCKSANVADHVSGTDTGKGSGEHANKFKQWLLEDNYVHLL